MSLVCLFGKSIASTDLLSVTAVGGTVNIPETGKSESSQSYSDLFIILAVDFSVS